MTAPIKSPLPGYLTLLLLLTLLTGCGEPPAGSSEQTATAVPTAPVTLTQADVSITVDPDYGARITSLKYKGREVLRTERDSAGFQFGSTVWTGPQEDWKWPPPPAFDSEPYSVTKMRDNVYIFTSEVDAASELRMEKRVEIGPSGEIGLRYRVKNEGSTSASVGAWEVTRIPYSGRIEFPVGDTIWSNQEELYTTVDTEGVGTIRLDGQVPDKTKIFASLSDTAVHYYNNGLLFTKQTLITARNQTVPGQAPLEVYLSPGRGFAEFELHGGRYILDPGQSASMRVKWLVREQ